MSAFQMPNVFVIPPEEDHSPTWCYFDAAKRSDSTFIPVEANFSLASKNAILYAIDQHTNDCVEDDINYNCEAELYFEQGSDGQPSQGSHVPLCSPWGNYTESEKDSDVTEVVKVGRRTLSDEELERICHGEQTTDVTRSKTLKSRASKVFHSLKKVGKRKSIKLPRRRDNITFPTSSFFTPSPIMGTSDKDSERSKTLPKQSPILVSEIFTPPTRHRPLSCSRAEESIILPNSHSNPPLTTPEVPDTGILFFHEHDRMHSNKRAFPPRMAFPNSSLLNKSRFSKINIPKLFSFATSTSSAYSTSSTILDCSTLSSNDDIALAPPSLDSDHRQGIDYVDNAAKTFSHHNTDSTSSQLSCTAVPATEKTHSSFVYDGTELEFSLGGDFNLGFGLELDVPIACQMNGAFSTQSSNSCKADRKPQRALHDDGFEMRLDSLRFDDLSFDVNTFQL